MKSYIPFVNSSGDAPYIERYFNDPRVVRISLDNRQLAQDYMSKYRLWVDPAIDAFGDNKNGILDEKLKSFFAEMEGAGALEGWPNRSAPDDGELATFCDSLLSECIKFKPTWISVPQLAISLKFTKEANAVNRKLAKSVQMWKGSARKNKKFVVPVILTSMKQYHLKQERTKVKNQTRRVVDQCGADGVWLVDKSLKDWLGPTTLSRRLQDLVTLHEEMRKAIDVDIFVAGPYWATNLLLWCKGLATNPAVGLGRGFQYYSPGGHMKRGRVQIAIPSLRRPYIADAELGKVLDRAAREYPAAHKLRVQYELLSRDMSNYLDDRDSARRQVADFYADWIGMLESVPPTGRSMALFQDLSKAFVNGKAFKGELPKHTNGMATTPGQVAEQLMLRCL